MLKYFTAEVNEQHWRTSIHGVVTEIVTKISINMAGMNH